MSQTSAPTVRTDDMRQLVLDWLLPKTKNGTLQELAEVFKQEMTGAVEAQAQPGKLALPANSEEVLALVRLSLGRWQDLLDAIKRNPDVVPVLGALEVELWNVDADILNWIFALDARAEQGTPQAEVAPPIAAVLQEGGVP